jgi:septal ring-binding cell division protein DamX
MRLILALAAVGVCLAVAAPDAEAQSRKRRGETVIVVKQRSYLDAGTQVQPGAYQNYSLGQTPFRPSDSIVPTGSAQSRLLPGPYGAFR